MMHRKNWLTKFALSAVCFFSLSIPNFPQPYSARSLTLKTTRYALEIEVDYDAKKVFGNCRMTVQNPTDRPISHIPLILYRLLKVTDVTDEKGAAISYRQDVLSLEDWEELQVNYTEVRLSEPLAPGQSLTIGIAYEGFLFGYSNEGWMYVKDHIDKEFTIMRKDGFGYPALGYPNLQRNRMAGFPSYDYTLSVTVPEDLVVANGGKLTGKSTINGRTTYTYRNIKPAWRMDMPIAPYGIVEDKANNLKIFHFPEDKENAGMILEGMKKTIQLCTNWFGPPDDFQGFTIIEVPEGYGSQADISSILRQPTPSKTGTGSQICTMRSPTYGACSPQIPCLHGSNRKGWPCSSST